MASEAAAPRPRVVSGSLDTRDWQRGALLGRVPLAAAAARWGAPLYLLHRADLHDALRTALGDRHLTLGARCVAVEQDGATAGALRRSVRRLRAGHGCARAAPDGSARFRIARNAS